MPTPIKVQTAAKLRLRLTTGSLDNRQIPCPQAQTLPCLVLNQTSNQVPEWPMVDSWHQTSLQKAIAERPLALLFVPERPTFITYKCRRSSPMIGQKGG